MTKRVALVCTLLVVAFLGSVDIASACTSRCIRVDVGGPICRQCLDVGYYTGVTCYTAGDCGCIYTQNTCGTAAQAEAQAEPAQDNVCQALPFAEAMAAPVAAD